MPSKRVKRVDLRGQSLDGVELFAKYHIVGMRHSKNGYITQVKHVQFGWMKPQDYYMLQKAHDLLPLLEKIVEGGYRLKAALYTLSVSVLGATLPVGMLIPGSAVLAAKWFIDNAKVNPQDAAMSYQAAAILLAAVILPYGDLYLLYVLFGDTIMDLLGIGPPEPVPAGETSSAPYVGPPGGPWHRGR